MERVALIDNLKKLEQLDAHYNRVYYGSEFCDQLMPSVSGMEAVFTLCAKRRVEISVVLPYINQRNSGKAVSLLRYLSQAHPETELVVNDYGLLYLAGHEYKNFTIVLGRIFSRQKRGVMLGAPDGADRLKNMIKTDQEEAYLFQSILENADAVDFFKAMGITRFGVDNIPDLPHIIDGVSVDLYFPYVFLTTTNYCVLFSAGTGSRNRGRADECPGFCQTADVKRIDINGVQVCLKGNAQFAFNEKILPDKNISRLVEVII